MQALRGGSRLQRCLHHVRRSSKIVRTQRNGTGGSCCEATPLGSGVIRRNMVCKATRVLYCRECGDTMTNRIPPDDTRERLVCSRCGYIDYRNPKIVVGCLVEHEDQILLCARGIEPCKGLWTLPAGFLEIGESTASGAVRETLEEANAKVTVLSMLTMLDVPIIGQCHIYYRARLESPFHFSPGSETLQTELVKPDEIDFGKIAFTTVMETIKAYNSDRQLGRFRFHHGVIVRRAGASPNDASAYKLENYTIQ